MIFKRLNYQTLQSLRLQGYNILLTIAGAEDENPIYSLRNWSRSIMSKLRWIVQKRT